MSSYIGDLLEGDSVIVHIFNSGVVSGPEKLVLPALRNLKQENVKVFFLTERRQLPKGLEPLEYARRLGLCCHRIDVSGRFDLRCIRELAILLRKNHVGIAHAHDVKASTYLLAAKWFGRLSNLRIISTHHGVRARPGLKLRLFEKFYVGCVLPYFHRTLAVCSSDRDLLISRGLKREQVATHLNGIAGTYVDINKRSEQRKIIYRSWELDRRGVSQDAQLIGFVGRLEREKCVGRALSIFSRLCDLGLEGPVKLDPHFVIFGTGSLQNDLQNFSRQLGLEKRVHWMNYRSSLGEEMAGFDLLFMVSEAEGLPITALEASWSGTPVVAPAIDGFLDLFLGVQEGGLFAPNADDDEVAEIIRGFLQDPSKREHLGAALQQRARYHFSQESWLDGLMSLYKKLGVAVSNDLC